MTRGAGFEPSTPQGGHISCFSLRFHCLASARLLQTKQKSLKSVSSRGACSFRNAIFDHAMTKTAANTSVFARDLAKHGRKSLSENRTGFKSRTPIIKTTTKSAQGHFALPTRLKILHSASTQMNHDHTDGKISLQ